jgi:glutamate carboxypeptidase
MPPAAVPVDPGVLTAATERLVRWTTQSSPSGDLAGLRAMAATLAADFAALGLGPTVVELPTSGGPQPVVLAHGAAITSPGDPQPGALLLVGHLDTVLPAFPVARAGNRLLASGAVDMKGGLAALWGALAARRQAGMAPPPDLLLVVVPDEEVGGELSHHAMRHWGAVARAVLVLEPGNLTSGAGELVEETVVIGRRGLFTWHLDVAGRSAHAGNAFWQGRSAIAAAAEFAAAAVGLAVPGDGPTVNPARIVGGEADFVAALAAQADLVGSPRQLNVVPDRAVVEGEARFLRRADGARLRQELADLAAAVGARREVRAHFTVTGEIPPLDPAGAAAALAARAAVLARALGFGLSAETERGGISFPNLLPDPSAVPVLDGLGPAGGGMHTRDEWVDLDSLARRIALLAALLDELG